MPDPIRTYDFKPGLPLEIELVSIFAIFREHKSAVIEPHRADFYHIFWFTQGTPVHMVDFIPISIQPNTLLFINKNRVHLFDQSGQYDGWVLLFTDAFFSQNPQDAQFLHNTILFHDLLDIPTLQLNQTQTDLSLDLSTAYRQQTPVMANSNAFVSRLTVITEDPLLFEVELTIGPDQLRTYAIQKLSSESIDNPLYQVAAVHQGTTGSFSKLSESDLYYMVTSQSLTDEE